jgi:aminoglycoside/choline kinase family phosphotransferase
MKQNKFPAGWDEERVRQLLARYEDQTEAEAIAEDEAAFADQSEVVMGVPRALVPLVRELIAKHQQ